MSAIKNAVDLEKEAKKKLEEAKKDYTAKMKKAKELKEKDYSKFGKKAILLLDAKITTDELKNLAIELGLYKEKKINSSSTNG